MLFISAGHHPTKPGACFGSFCEYDEAIVWVERLMEIWSESYSHLPELNRVPGAVLREKVGFINARAPALAIEIHFNSAKNAEGEHIGRGSETLYYPGSVLGKECAEIIQGELASVFEPDRGIKEGWYRMNPAKGPDYFLARTSCPSLIVEPEFIHLKDKIQSKRDAGCDVLAEGISRCWLDVLKKGIEDVEQ